MRNFWITLSCDGLKTKVATGPIKTDGGFQLTIHMRDHGQSVKAMKIQGYVSTSGWLKVEAISDVTDLQTIDVLTFR
jgi:hypothetical protein